MTGSLFAVLLAGPKVPAGMPDVLSGSFVALYWAGFAATLAWGLYVSGCAVGRASQLVAFARLRNALAVVAAGAVVAGVLVAPASAQASRDLPALPPVPDLFVPEEVAPGLYHVLLPADMNPLDVIDPDVLIDCDYFPWAIECWFAQ